MLELWRAAQFCDVKIWVEGHDIDAHRVVLAAGSDMLRAMFSSTMSDSQTGSIELHEVSADALHQALEFLYAGRLVLREVDELLPLLQVAHRLQMGDLVETTCKAILCSAAALDSRTLWSLADALVLPDLQVAAQRSLHEQMDDMTVAQIAEHLRSGHPVSSLCALQRLVFDLDAAGDDSEVLQQWITQSVCNLVVAAMINDKGYDVQLAGCHALYYICRIEEQREVATEAGACVAIMTAMCEHASDTNAYDVLLHGCGALAQLCGMTNDGSEHSSDDDDDDDDGSGGVSDEGISITPALQSRREAIVKAGAIKVVINVLNSHLEQPPRRILSKLCCALRHMCAFRDEPADNSSPRSPFLWQQAVDEGAVGAVIGAVRCLSREGDQSYEAWFMEACSAFRGLVLHVGGGLSNELVLAGACDAILTGVRHYSRHRSSGYEAVTQCFHALSAMRSFVPQSSMTAFDEAIYVDLLVSVDDVRGYWREGRGTYRRRLDDRWSEVYHAGRDLAIALQPNVAWQVALPFEMSVRRRQFLRDAGKYEELHTWAESHGQLDWVHDALSLRRTAGYSAEAAKAAGITIDQMKAAGYLPQECKRAGFTLLELVSAGHVTRDVCSAREARAAGTTIDQMKAAGYRPQECKRAGVSIEELAHAGHMTRDVCSAEEARAAGLTTEQMKAAGYHPKECKRAGFTLLELVSAGHLTRDVCSAREARAAGTTIRQMVAAGYRPVECKQVGFSSVELAHAGYATRDVCSAEEARAAGLTIEQMKAAGYRPYECKVAGFSFEEASRAGFDTWGRKRREFWFSTGKYAQNGLAEQGRHFGW